MKVKNDRFENFSFHNTYHGPLEPEAKVTVMLIFVLFLRTIVYRYFGSGT